MTKQQRKTMLTLKILKLSSETTANVLHRLFNKIFKRCKFPDDLKFADITVYQLCKKKHPFKKRNYGQSD